MKTSILFSIQVLFLFSICSCARTVVMPTTTANGPDVYVAGTQTVGSITNAVVSKNGVVTNITNGPNNIEVSGLYVTPNGDVYVSGYETIGTHTISKYWKNGVATVLYSNIGTNDTKTTGIYVAGNGGDVYVSGEETFVNSTGALRTVPKFWRDYKAVGGPGGTSGIFLGNSYFASTSSHSSGIALFGNDVYVAGWEEEPYANLTSPKVWKNFDLPTTLGSANANHHAKTRGITIAGNDIYVAGRENENSVGITGATIWKNGIIIMSVSAGNGASIANSVAYWGGTFYFCGFIPNPAGTYPNAYTFKNGAGFTNLNAISNMNGEALDMKISTTGDVYAIGYEGNIAKLWQNGVASNPFGSMGTSVAKAVYVQ